jgi:hypothetical protein
LKIEDFYVLSNFKTGHLDHKKGIVEFRVIAAEWPQMPPYSTQKSKIFLGACPQTPLPMRLLENLYFPN